MVPFEVVQGVVQVGAAYSVGFGVILVALADEAAPVLGVAAAAEVVAVATSCRPTAAVTVAFPPPSRPADASNLLCLHHTVFVDREVPVGSRLDLLPVVPVSPTSALEIDRDHRSS